jgi:hypothetical protein
MAKRVSLKGRGADIFFGEGVAAAAPSPDSASPPTPDPVDIPRADTSANSDRPTDRSNERTNGTPIRPRTSRTSDRPFERTNERLVVRHSFDVLQDQLLALADIQAEIFRSTRRKPKLGELVQQALDDYIQRHRRRTNGRSNERTTG